MRFIFIQTSVEFLLLLGALILLSLLSLTLFSNTFKNFTKINFHVESANISISNKPVVYLYYNNYSTLYNPIEINIIAYGCIGNMSLYFYSTTIKFEYTNLSFPLDFSSHITQYAVPEHYGLDNFTLFYTIKCNREIYNDSMNGFVYVYANSTRFNNIYFSYKQSNTSLIINKENNLTYFKIFSHCTYLNFFYNPLPMSMQCGTSNGWYYTTFSDYCFYTGKAPTTTTCIIPEKSAYFIEKPSFLYKVNVSIVYNNELLLSDLSNFNNKSFILYNGKDVGYMASYVNFSNEFIGNDIALGNVNKTLLPIINTTLYNLEETLSYYNGTNIDSNEQNIINDELYEYNNSLYKLERFKPLPCRNLSNYFLCPINGFNYTFIANTTYLFNTTLYNNGSMLKVI